MARRCFEVNQLKIYFWCTDKERDNLSKHVSTEVNRFLKKYASNTSYTISSKEITECDFSVELIIKFSKNISVMTVINFLSYLEMGSYSSINIKEKEKTIIAEILK